MSDGKLVIDVVDLMQHLCTDNQQYQHRLQSCHDCQAYNDQTQTCTVTGVLVVSSARHKQAVCPLLIW